MQETSTRSPGRTLRTAAPTSSTVPTASWPSTVPAVHLGHVALEDVQVGAADRHGVDADDGIGVVDDRRVGDLLPVGLTGTVVDECVHGFLRSWGGRLVRLSVRDNIGSHLGQKSRTAGREAPLDDLVLRGGSGRVSLRLSCCRANVSHSAIRL